MDLSILNSGKIAETTYLTDEMFRRQDSTNRSYGFSREMGYYKASITGLNMMVGQEWWLPDGRIRHDVYTFSEQDPQMDGRHFAFEGESGLLTQKHHHDYYELIYVIRAHYVNLFGSDQMDIRKGEWLLMNRNVIHGEESTGDVCLLQIHIPQADMGIILEQMKSSEELATFFAEKTPGRNTANMEYLIFRPKSADTKVDELTGQLITAQVWRYPGSVLIVRGLMTAIFSFLDDRGLYEFHDVTYEIYQKRLLFLGLENWLEKRLWDFDIQEMERDFGYTYSYLRHLVKDCTGESITAYCTEHKLNHAAQLLSTTDLSVQQILEKLNYNNKTYFYRLFRDKYGVSPTEYRRQPLINQQNNE